ncbi:structural protein [Avian nephritis virus 1]|uniref:Structural protein n=1 Tax=Avian nephritis virus 1 TaxID=336960 RepID=F2VU09_ANV1|nr:structural protein [Avian nephritis virus 1]
MPGPAGPGNGGTRPKTQLAKPKKAKKLPSQKKPSSQKPLKKELKKVEKQVKVLKKRTNGPKTDDTMKTTVTIGTISGQTTNGLSRQNRVAFNPLLLKTTSGGNTTPLSIRSSMCEMWRLRYVEVIATPLTGYSNIVGSVGFIALTLNGLEATADSIDTIKARRHYQMSLGKPARMRIPARELAGPREGWWLVDTSQSPADSYGPALDLLLAYRTENLLSTTGTTTSDFKGALWQVEVKVVYDFSTYNPKPGLQTLISQTLPPDQQVTITTSAQDGSLIMTTTSPSLIRLLTPRVGGQRSGKSETIWAIAAAAVDAAAGVLGPWGYLLKGGFWLVRKIFGPSTLSTTTAQYQVYPCIESAMSDQPIFGGTGSEQVTLPLVHISEVMNPNSEVNNLQPSAYSLPPAPPQPSEDPELPLALLTGQSGVPPVYQYGGSEYTPQPKWSGSTMILTGVPHHKHSTGTTSPFGVRVNSMTPANVNQLDVYEFSDFAIFFGFGNYLGEGPMHTGKTMLYSLFDGSDVSRPWLDAAPARWQLPAWTGFAVPGAGDFYLQMQAVTDKSTRTTSTGCYFLVAYRTSRRLIAFHHAGASAAPAPDSLLCLYNVDAGRPPVLTNFNFQLNWDTQALGLQHSNEVELDGESDDDDISLADSFINSEFGGVDQLEKEREHLLRRLRDIDAKRFTI